jgi:hypothetical protein
MECFIYSVFEEKLKSDKGKSLVQDYEDSRDAQCYTPHLSGMPSSQQRRISPVIRC